MLTASTDTTLRLWNAETGNELLVLRGHRAEIWRACFTPDGRQVISASLDGTLRWWWLEADDILAAAEALGPPELTEDERRRLAQLRDQ